MTLLVGLNTAGTQAAYGSYSPNNGVVSSLFTASVSGTATSVYARISLNAGYSYRAAIYNAAGTTKLADSVAVSDSVTGWVQFTLNSSIAIVSGTQYKLAIISNGSYLWLEADATGFKDFETTGVTYPTWPSSLGSSGVGNGALSIYADGTAGGGAAIAASSVAASSSSVHLGQPGIRVTLRDMDTNALKNAVTYANVHVLLASNRASVFALFTNVTTSAAGVLQLQNPNIQYGTSYDIAGWSSDGTDRFHASAVGVDTSV